ncbi:glycosyltransferase family 39 protein [Algoriphagus sp. AK58]|uniref:glycosyltransferase family 39 protein n=1 Tax=Algoriphagus sp. AK58 TaxID=1406877 RepID=UPI00164F6832|nr:glycosyltransferase family 39 protein [Algoriphagus sp. AK58]MBC6367500.1 hypothetical protein [Algoriphagus sp. AK58]
MKINNKKVLFEMLTKYEKTIFLVCFLCYGAIHFIFFDKTEWLNTDYEKQINSIAMTDDWFFVNGVFSSRVPPLMPITYGLLLKLSLFFNLNIVFLGKIINLLFISLNSFLLYKISSLLLERRFWMVPSLLYLLSPVIIYYSFKPLSEHMFMVFFLLFIFYLIKFFLTNKGGFLSWSLVSFSVSLLVRPNYLYFSAFLILYLIFTCRKNLKTLILPFSLGFLVLLPWSLYCFQNSNTIVISSSGNIQSLKDGIAYDNKEYRNTLTNDEEIRYVMDEFWENYSSYTSTKQVFEYYLSQLEQNPLGLIKFQALKILRVFFGTDTINKRFEFFILLINIPIILMFLFWIFKLKSNNLGIHLKVFFLCLLVYSILIGSVVVPLFRYLIPVFYLIPVLAFSEIKLLKNE